MIFRIYVVYNRSRIILGVLLLMYIPEVIMIIVSSEIYTNLNKATRTYRTKSADQRPT